MHRALFSLIAFAACAMPGHAQGVRPLGRTVLDGGALVVQWSASGFEAEFAGPTFTAHVKDGGESLYDIEVDGRVTLFAPEDGEKAYTLFNGAAGRHAIRVTRRTGINSGETRFSALKAGGLAPTDAPERRLLVIGDSISTGYGVGGSDQHCGFTYASENANEAYPVLTARSLGADVHVIAVDGFGLIKNYDGGPPTMRQLSSRPLPWNEGAWPTASYLPQAIIVNLGTNDFAHGDPGDAFDRAYVDFLAELRVAYPKAFIIGAGSPMLNGREQAAQRDSVRQAIEARQRAGDKQLGYITLNMANGARAYGCDWHPGLATQKGMALALEDAITRALGWSKAPAGGGIGRPG